MRNRKILEYVRGYRIEFTSTPRQVWRPVTLSFDDTERAIISLEIEQLLHKNVICESRNVRDSFIFTVFIRNKKDGAK